CSSDLRIQKTTVATRARPMYQTTLVETWSVVGTGAPKRRSSTSLSLSLGSFGEGVVDIFLSTFFSLFRNYESPEHQSASSLLGSPRAIDPRCSRENSFHRGSCSRRRSRSA